MDIEIGEYYGYKYSHGDWLYVQIVECDTDNIRVMIIRDMDSHQPKWKKGTIHKVGRDSFHGFVKFTESEMMYEVL